MKAVIFGASGQDGFYLSHLLERRGVNVTGISRSGGNGNLTGQVADRNFVDETISRLRPDFIFHLAANSTTSHDAIFENCETIGDGTINILEAVYRDSPHSRVFLSGSALQFENLGEPIGENTPFAALSPYAVSRIASVYAGRYYRSLGIKVYAGYFFNHDSPLRGERHINQKIVGFVKKLGLGFAGTLEIGDVEVRKEFNFAGDIVEAIWTLVNQEDVFEAVLGCGQAHSIEDWLRICFGSVDRDWREFVSIRSDYRSEYRILVSKPDLIKSLGWRPRLSIEDLAKIMLDA